MENNYQGDLADIFRPGGSVNSGADPPGVSVSVSDWQFFDQETQMIQKSILRSSSNHDHEQLGFGQPFTSLLTDPLIHEDQDQDQGTTSSFFRTTTNLDHDQLGFDHHHDHKINNDNDHNNIFSKMLQISPNNVIKSTTLSSSNNNHDMMITSSSSTSDPSSSSAAVVVPPPLKRCLLETSSSAVQISSPRNTGIKRRKSQAKKVVCIPAPAPANSRPTGEVVPSDLWAWRKYGQKPIKGSPYPRGYYRCSSSKGCSARKQVERSRTDPNMLVITYTSEHNHPWPTQRNALAGSTRTPQPPKTANEQPPQPPPEKQLEVVKHEDDHESQSLLLSLETDHKLGFQSNFPQSYRPELPQEHGGGSGGNGSGGGGGQVDQDFFSSLGEIEVDPISMLLNQGFLGGDDEDQDQLAENYNNKDLDPFG